MTTISFFWRLQSSSFIQPKVKNLKIIIFERKIIITSKNAKKHIFSLNTGAVEPYTLHIACLGFESSENSATNIV